MRPCRSTVVSMLDSGTLATGLTNSADGREIYNAHCVIKNFQQHLHSNWAGEDDFDASWSERRTSYCKQKHNGRVDAPDSQGGHGLSHLRDGRINHAHRIQGNCTRGRNSSVPQAQLATDEMAAVETRPHAKRIPKKHRTRQQGRCKLLQRSAMSMMEPGNKSPFSSPSRICPPCPRDRGVDARCALSHFSYRLELDGQADCRKHIQCFLLWLITAMEAMEARLIMGRAASSTSAPAQMQQIPADAFLME